jgi:hypothetical protein
MPHYVTCTNVDTFNIDDIQFKAKLIRKNKDQFDLVSKTFTTHYFRLKTQLDTAGLINGNEDTLDKYVKEWRERKYNWETDFKKQKE